MMHRHSLEIASPGRGLVEITHLVRGAVSKSGLSEGLVHLFVHHTSASLIIQENADPDVRRDLDAFFARLVPDGDPIFRHTAEGPDDMSAHIRSVLTASQLSVPMVGGELDLGTWQGIYLWEHRAAAHRRRVTVTVHGA